MSEIGTLLQNRYLIERKIGTGGMGAVYLAVDKRFDNHVAIKETFYKEDEFADAFEREAKLLNGLQHPALPHVSDYFAEGSGYFLVMQFIDGEDLSDKLKRDGAFPLAEVARWTDELLDALDYLHTQNPPVIHRDIKPHNLKLSARGSIMLLDFGLAKLNQKDATEVSVFGYSRTYSPLEQIQGTGTDARSDIFALGATVYHLLTGKAPTNALTRASAIVNGDPDPLPAANVLRPEIPESLSSVVHTALALNPQSRFATAQAMRQALEHAAADVAKSDSPRKTMAVIGAASAQVIETDNKNFPALESFAAAKNAAVNASPDEATPAIITDQQPTSSKPLVVDIAPRASFSDNFSQNKLLWAAAAVLLFIGIGAAFYFSGSNHPAEATTQTPAANVAPNVSTNRETVSKTSATDKKDEKSEAEKSKPDADKPTRSAAKTESNEKTPTDEPLTTDGVQPAEIIEPQVEDDAPKVKKRNRDEQGIPDVMTEEEFQKLKREEKEKRRQRREKPTPDNELDQS